MASAFDSALPPVGGDGTSTPHPDPPQRSAPSDFDTSLPQTKDTQSAPPSTITGTSWQTILGNPQVYGTVAPPGMETISPDTASGILHGVREGIIDRPSLGLANFWDWATGGNQSAQVREANKAAADAARTAAIDDPGGYQAGNQFGRTGSQMAVVPPALRVAGWGISKLPMIGPAIAPFITGTAGEATPGIIGTGLRTAAGGTSGALAGGGTAALSGDDPIRGLVEGGLFGGGLSLGAQGLQRALQTVRGTYVPPEVRTPSGSWQASDETAQRATQAKTLTDAGVPVMTRQVSQDPALRVTDAPWSGASGDLTNQQQAFRRASLSKVTGQGDGTTPGAPTLATDQFVADQSSRIGGNFQGVAGRNNIDFGTDVAPQLTRLGMTPMDRDTREAIAPYIHDVVNSVTRDPISGQPIISGAKYLDLTGSDSPLQRVASAGGLPGKFAQDIIDTLHNGLAASASPADQALLTVSRQQYRALQAVKDARGSDGSFEPKDLFSATDAQSKRYGGSSGTLDPLAKAGTTVLQPSYGGGAPYKGTATAVGAAAVPAGVGTLAAHAVPGLLSASGAAAVPAAVTALGLPPALQALNRNPQNLARAIQILQGGADYAPYTMPRQVVAPGVVATQQ